jgi:hypothetical protein
VAQFRISARHIRPFGISVLAAAIVALSACGSEPARQQSAISKLDSLGDQPPDHQTLEAAEREVKRGEWLPLDPVANSGSQAEIEIVKREVVRLFNDNLALHTGARPRKDYQSVLQRIFTPATARKEARDIRRGLAEVEPADVLASETLTVDRWLGVRVSGVTALALAEVTEHYVRKHGGRRTNRAFRYQFDLLKIGGSWKIARYGGEPQDL